MSFKNKQYLIVSFALVFNLMAPLFCLKAQANPIVLSTIKKSKKKSQFVGDWEVRTKVVWSDCPYVKEGNIAKSKMSISDVNGRLIPNWDTGKWKLVQHREINFLNQEKFTWERENKFFDPKAHEFWQVESKDKFELINGQKMRGESLVKQYLDGSYVGSYMTISYLVKK